METMVLLLVKVTLVGAMGRVLLAAMRNASASVKYLLAVVSLGAMLAVMGIAGSGLEWRVAVLRPASPPAARVEREVAPPAQELVDESISAAPASPSIEVLPAGQGRGGSLPWLVLAYLAGSVLALARVVAGMVALRSVTRTAAPVDDQDVRRELDRATAMLEVAEPVRVVVSGRATVPAMWGMARPVVLLPERALAWPAQRLRVVFLHELAHWIRRDVLTLLLRRLVTSLLWFHPIAWSLERVARRECERACDDVVLGVGTRASDYALHLLTIARSLPGRGPPATVTLAIARASEFEGRVKAILGAGRPRSRVSRGALSGIVLAAAVVVVPLAAVRAVAQPAALAPPLAEVQEMDRQEKPIAGGVPAKGITPERAEEWAQLGKSYLRQRRYPEAIEALSNAIRAEPFYATARYNLACAYALSGDRAAALAALREAVRAGYSGGGHMRKDEDLVSIRGSELDALADLADQLSLGAKGDDWSSVIPRYERVVRDHPDIPQAWFNLGFALISSNQDRRGIEAFTRALQMGYRPGTTMYNLGCAYAHLGERQTAIEWLHRSAAAGFDVGNQARSDRDLDSVRSDPWLASMVAATIEKKKGKDKNND